MPGHKALNLPAWNPHTLSFFFSILAPTLNSLDLENSYLPLQTPQQSTLGGLLCPFSTLEWN